MADQRWIALLRAINVGGHTVKMDALRAMFEALGYTGVSTFIASGNVLFSAPGDPAELEPQIEGHLRRELGYEVATFLRTPAELTAAAAHEPFPRQELEAEGSTLYVAFLRALPPEDARQKLLGMATDDDGFHFHGRELYWLRRRRISDSIFSGALFEKTLRAKATVRNITTVRKLAAKA